MAVVFEGIASFETMLIIHHLFLSYNDEHGSANQLIVELIFSNILAN